MNAVHRRGCEQPEPDQRTTVLSDGRRITVHTCPTCGCVALTEESR